MYSNSRPIHIYICFILFSLLSGCLFVKNNEYGKGVDTEGQSLPDPFHTVYESILKNKCASCHQPNGTAASSNLNFENISSAYLSLVNQASSQGGGILVTPGNADESYLFKKISSSKLAFGSQMPLGSAPLSPSEIELIQAWISQLKAPFLCPEGFTKNPILKKCDLCIDSNLISNDVYSLEVYPIIQKKCAGCHGANGYQGIPNLQMGTPAQFVSSTVNKPSSFLSHKTLIIPGNPDNSYLIQKISNTSPDSGTKMPPPPANSLTQSEISTIKKWILSSAPGPTLEIPLGYTNTCKNCTGEDSLMGNSKCHPCNGPNPPSYCVDKKYFESEIIPIFDQYCAICHINDKFSPGNMILDTLPQLFGEVKSGKERIKAVYNGIVGVGKSTPYDQDPPLRVAPSDTLSSLLYMSLHYDAIPKRPSIGQMPQRVSKLPEAQIAKIRNWILSGAPGP